jgi:hypothetical protein
MFGAKVPCIPNIGLDRADDGNPFIAERGLHKIAAPAAEADNRR